MTTYFPSVCFEQKINKKKLIKQFRPSKKTIRDNLTISIFLTKKFQELS